MMKPWRDRLFGIGIGMILPTALTVGGTSFASDVTNGGELYRNNCANCHGPSGTGDGYKLFNPPVADLTSAAIQQQSTDELVGSIHRGRANTAMGSWRLALSEAEMREVVAYLRTLKKD